jgi:hypothetical protein
MGFQEVGTCIWEYRATERGRVQSEPVELFAGKWERAYLILGVQKVSSRKSSIESGSKSNRRNLVNAMLSFRITIQAKLRRDEGCRIDKEKFGRGFPRLDYDWTLNLKCDCLATANNFSFPQFTTQHGRSSQRCRPGRRRQGRQRDNRLQLDRCSTRTISSKLAARRRDGRNGVQERA